MGVFSRVDLLSRYWAGDGGGQTKRMVGFLDRFLHPGKHDESRLEDRDTGKRYTWRLDFSPETLGHPHYSIYHDAYDRLWVLVIALTSLVEYLRQGQQRYLRAQPDREGHRVERFEPVALDRVEHAAGLLGGEGVGGGAVGRPAWRRCGPPAPT
jgi:hypothetical protein